MFLFPFLVALTTTSALRQNDNTKRDFVDGERDKARFRTRSADPGGKQSIKWLWIDPLQVGSNRHWPKSYNEVSNQDPRKSGDKAFKRQNPEKYGPSSKPTVLEIGEIQANIWYRFPEPVVISKFSFRNRAEPNERRYDPLEFDLVGSNSVRHNSKVPPGRECTGWNVITSIKNVKWTTYDEQKNWTVESDALRRMEKGRYFCYGLKFRKVNQSNWVALQDMQMWIQGKCDNQWWETKDRAWKNCNNSTVCDIDGTEVCPQCGCKEVNQTKPKFLYVDNEPKTWPEARADCKRRGADLATIETRADMDEILRIFSSIEGWYAWQNKGVITSGRYIRTSKWIGGYKKENKAKRFSQRSFDFFWTSGQRIDDGKYKGRYKGKNRYGLWFIEWGANWGKNENCTIVHTHPGKTVGGSRTPNVRTSHCTKYRNDYVCQFGL